jgi:hypothetical protein
LLAETSRKAFSENGSENIVEFLSNIETIKYIAVIV